ncbi:unnamed protein product [Sphenostylis stenocarpa]|uniref:Nudix hydrolase domain-containing protein n=1 Tax=Sphenostylis stenocarpa TaxID=92480 RepID=A0AA86RST4_9FABA|nr:unnamed protein product [Sphenostylis stenocarpa]
MSSVPARTGRQRQRYEDNLRLVSGCIPYRWRKFNTDLMGETEEIIEVLMVSSPKRDDLVFPKGGWEDDETVTEAACREALEEAGVKGILREIPLGIWEFRSKSSQDLCVVEGGCRGYMFALEVTEELNTWPEQKNRARQWLNIEQAFRLSRYDWMRNALEAFLRVMAEDRKLDEKEDQNIELEAPSIIVADVPECQSISPNCYKISSTMQHHGMPPSANLLSCATQEIAIHFGY